MAAADKDMSTVLGGDSKKRKSDASELQLQWDDIKKKIEKKQRCMLCPMIFALNRLIAILC